MSEILFYDEWSNLLKEDCSIETINKCPNDGYWSIENIETIINKNIDIIGYIPKSILYSDRVINIIVDKFPTKVIELPIEFSERLSIEQIGQIILKHSKYKNTYLSRINNSKRRKEVEKYIEDNTIINKMSNEEYIEMASKLTVLKNQSPNVLNMLSEIMSEILIDKEKGRELLKELERSIDKYSKKELEEKCLKYFIEKDKISTELLSKHIK